MDRQRTVLRRDGSKWTTVEIIHHGPPSIRTRASWGPDTAVSERQLSFLELELGETIDQVDIELIPDKCTLV